MNGRTRVFILIFAFAGIGAAVMTPILRGQFLPAEIEQRAGQEEFLKKAKIVAAAPVGEGVTAPWKLTLSMDGFEHKAVWKCITTAPGGPPDEWRCEIAAYRLDKLIGLGAVPPVVERFFQGKYGSLSYWAESKCSLLTLEESNGAIQIPPEALEKTNRMKYVCRLWDSLIANDDRTQQNILFTEDWRTILIDHSRAFRSDGEYGKRLIYGARGIKWADDGAGGRRLYLFRQVPRALVERLKALNDAALRDAVGAYLKRWEIKAVLARRDLILAEIAEMVARDGEDEVLY